MLILRQREKEMSKAAKEICNVFFVFFFIINESTQMFSQLIICSVKCQKVGEIFLFTIGHSDVLRYVVPILFVKVESSYEFNQTLFFHVYHKISFSSLRSSFLLSHCP